MDIVCCGLIPVVVIFFSTKSSSRKYSSTLNVLAVKFLFLASTFMLIDSAGFHSHVASLVWLGSVISVISR